MTRNIRPFILIVAITVLAGCGSVIRSDDAALSEATRDWRVVNLVSPGADPHSFSRPDLVSVDHLALELDVDFAREVLSGTATLSIENHTGTDQLILDTRDLTIREVTWGDGRDARWFLTQPTERLGRALVIELVPGVERVVIDYETSPEAAAVQWLGPGQTASGKPFLFTQSQAILARTWVPIQDTPGVRFTYDATVRVPQGMLALMSAENPTSTNSTGVYSFRMPQPIPSYLLALAAGDLRFRSLGPRSGVYAEPSVVEAAAYEFADTPRMMVASEEMYGPYRWGRYDILVLPASFPFGGMENPRLTFATPTIIAGDRSLVSLVAHELAHSWSGNLVTNATWNDFWLNEGFTNYFTERIMEELYGRDYSEMLAVLDLQDLRAEIDDLGQTSPDTHLYLDLAGRDPDEGMTEVAYVKGHFFLRWLDQQFGRERFDRFLREWFDEHAFESRTTAEFIEFLDERLLSGSEIDVTDVHRWIYSPALPSTLREPQSDRFSEVENEIDRFMTNTPATQLEVDGWSTHEWLHFIRNLPTLDESQMARLDAAFNLSETGNSEIKFAWLTAAIRADYDPAYPVLEQFLTEMGRRKFVLPLFRDLAKTEKGMIIARRIYSKTRPMYHTITRDSVDEALAWNE